MITEDKFITEMISRARTLLTVHPGDMAVRALQTEYGCAPEEAYYAVHAACILERDRVQNRG